MGREWRDPVSGRGNHHRRQHGRDVPADRRDRRRRAGTRHQGNRLDPARADDDCRQLKVFSPLPHAGEGALNQVRRNGGLNLV
ncbi:hypothetical protein CBM2623_A220036 [Cupriavidus taiwanensis]|nr:hypothetical protein CBM2608_A210033 [Cupriavidus taiwanensis]SPA27207.1 hypothetical protein CBM2623_A220036 [Cupriavidus taiwanensis]